MSETTNDVKNTKPRTKVGGAWVKTTKMGDKFLSLEISVDGKQYNFIGFKNKFRIEGQNNQPHYQLFESSQPTAPKKIIEKSNPEKILVVDEELL